MGEGEDTEGGTKEEERAKILARNILCRSNNTFLSLLCKLDKYESVKTRSKVTESAL